MPKKKAMDVKTGFKIDTKELFAKHPFAQYILKRLREHGFEAVLIGGVVRDAVRARLNRELGFEPQEVDIATSALPPQIKKLFKKHKIVEVGEAFGVLKILSPDGKEYEAATFRVEGEYDGRWPGKVKLVRTLKEDIQRRDLTINGLAATEDGTVIDYVDGVQDLKNKIIRTIGNPQERFEEDHLRLLRAIRFACLIDGEIHKETAKAIRQNAEKLAKISKERIRDELFALLETPRSAKGFSLLDQYGLLGVIMPELSATKGVLQQEKYHPEGDVFTHTLLALEEADKRHFEPLVKLAIALHDIGKPMAYERHDGKHAGGHELIGEAMAAKVCRRLRLSNEQTKLIKLLVREHLRIGKFTEMSRGKQALMMKEGENAQADMSDFSGRFPFFFRLLQLLIADCEASAHQSSVWVPVLEASVTVWGHLQELEELERARRLIDGNDLLNMGISQGPEVGRILKGVYEKILDGEIKSREQALEAARRLVDKLA